MEGTPSAHCEELVSNIESLADTTISEAAKTNVINDTIIVTNCENIVQIARELEKVKASGTSDEFGASVDRIDDAGVRIWNDTVKQKSSEAGALYVRLLGPMRSAALALLRLAASGDLNERVVVKLANLAMKTGRAWFDVGDYEKGREYYDVCLKYLDNPSERGFANSAEIKKLVTIVSAYKAELEFMDINSPVAFMLMRRALESDDFSSLAHRELQEVSRICLECARKASKQSDAIQWSKFAIDALESCQSTSSGEPDLKTEILLFLATLYLDTSAWETAEQAIDLALEESPDTLFGYYLKMKCLAQNGQPRGNIAEIFAQAVDKCSSKLTDPAAFKLLMGMIHLLAKYGSPSAAASGIDAALGRFTETASNIEKIEKLKILKVYLLISTNDPRDDISHEVDKIVESVCEDNAEPTLARTYRLILWQSADRAAQENRWDDAIKWFKCSRRLLLEDPNDARNAEIVRRKMATCYLELKEYELAYEALDIEDTTKEPSSESSFLACIARMELGDNIRAMEHLTRIPCTDDTFRYFICAAQLAFKKADKICLQKVLRHVVTSSLDWSRDHNKTNLLSVLRCLIRLTCGLLESTEREVALAEIVSYITKAFTLLKDWQLDESRDMAAFTAECTWLHRTAWNVALTAATVGETEHACSLYELTSDVICLADEETLPLLQIRKVCLFAVTAGYVSIFRKPPVTEDSPADFLAKALVSLTALRQVCTKISAMDSSVALRDDPVLHQSIYLEFEIKVKSELWTHVENILEYADSVESPVEVFERMADTVTRYKCPSAVVFLTIQATLNTIMKREPEFDMRKFSQWFRILIRTSLVANKPAALGLYQQVLSILKSSTGESSYPKQEIEWLMVTAWNLGCEYWSTNDSDYAKKWCELAMALSDYVDESPLITQIRQSYSDLLAT
ncbi:hypothetical protein DFJ77DRAFT_81035 [Powellomyces hirtus]|nr:hypothetical protein DFJ77DRAFT_81035 [Powellomyces hirtus]